MPPDAVPAITVVHRLRRGCLRGYFLSRDDEEDHHRHSNHDEDCIDKQKRIGNAMVIKKAAKHDPSPERALIPRPSNVLALGSGHKERDAE